MLDDRIKELIAIGSSVTANCHPCVKFHLKKAHEMNIDKEDIEQALEVGRMVRKGAAKQMDSLLEELR